MPRVLLLADELENGGSERQLALLIKYLPPEWARRVWSLGSGPFETLLRENGVDVRVRARQGRFDPRPTWDLWNTIRTWRPEVVHSWGWMCTAMAGGLCRTLRIPLVDSTIRNGMVSLRRERIRRWSLRGSKRIIANSQAGLRAWGIDPGRGRVITNGFDPERYKLCPENPTGRSPLTTVIMTGRMAPQKDYRTLIAAARCLIAQDGPCWRFICLGSGPDRQGLLAEAQDLIEPGYMTFPEPGLEVLGCISQAHIGVLMSHPCWHAEGCSNSIMEYMACGLPVVCGDSGGNRELVLDGQTGFVIPAQDPGALAGKLAWLRANPERAIQMGQAGKQRIAEHYSVETMVEKTLAVYWEAIQG